MPWSFFFFNKPCKGGDGGKKGFMVLEHMFPLRQWKQKMSSFWSITKLLSQFLNVAQLQIRCWQKVKQWYAKTKTFETCLNDASLHQAESVCVSNICIALQHIRVALLGNCSPCEKRKASCTYVYGWHAMQWHNANIQWRPESVSHSSLLPL